MELLNNSFFMFLNYLEQGRQQIFSYFSKILKNTGITVSDKSVFEEKLRNYNPYTIIIAFFIFFFVIKFFSNKIKAFWNKINSIEKIKIFFIRLALKFGSTRQKLEKTKKEIKEKALEKLKVNKFKKIDFRDKGQDYQTILNKLKTLNDVDQESINGPSTKITGCIYIKDDKLENLAAESFRMYGYSNLLHPDVFCSARFIESQLIKIGLDLFNGHEKNSCGVTTTGGTESILFACLAYRNRGYQMGIEHPEIIVPESIHAAFFKAGEAFGIKVVRIPLNPKTYQVDLKKVEKAINSNTIAMAGSFPNFPHGVYDDIEGISKLAVKYRIPLHVDACLGGLLVCFFGSAYITLPKFDFRLPGVTSISADLHKYGLCPKGISYLLYSDREYRKHQYFIYPHFMGGLYPSPGLEGSRSPAFIVAAYAIVCHVGKNRYINQAKAIHEAVCKIKNYIKKECPELEVIGDPQICSVAVKGPKTLYVHDQMTAMGWHLNMINNPSGFSFVVTSANLENVENGVFLKDLKSSYDYVVKNKDIKLSENVKLYGMSLNVPEAIVRDNLDIICDSMLDHQ